MSQGCVSPHFKCLDVLNLEWESSQHARCGEPVVMLEVWDTGAILHGGSDIPVGAVVKLTVEDGKVPGHVVKCAKDNDFGFVVVVGIDAPEQWFPTGHLPAWQLDTDDYPSASTDFAHAA